MKKLFFPIVFIILCVFGCQKGCSEKPKVAILKFVSHPALDELEDAFIRKLDSRLHSASLDFTIEKYNSNRDPQLAKQYAEVINRSDVKLILAIATPAAQALFRTPSNIPVLYGAVADPKGSGIIPSSRFTGIQNASPEIIEVAIKFISNAFPNVKRIGTIYNPAEQNSVFVQDILKNLCKKYNIDLIQRPVTDPTQVSSMSLELMNQKIDVLYSANDNTVNASIASVVSVCKSRKIPFVIGDLSTLTKGAVIAVGLEYKMMGDQLADIAFNILSGKTIADYPPQGAPRPSIWLNKEIMDNIKLNIKDSVYFYKNIDSIIVGK